MEVDTTSLRRRAARRPAPGPGRRSWSAKCATWKPSRPPCIAAETGHLVFSTLHTLDATETINRIIAVFPPHQQKQIRLQLAATLRAVICQRLVPRADGQGRVPAVEVMIATAYIRDCIIDAGEDQA